MNLRLRENIKHHITTTTTTMMMMMTELLEGYGGGMDVIFLLRE